MVKNTPTYSSFTLSEEQSEVLVGILLGDASLQTESNGKTYRLRISQSEEHKDYLFHLYELLQEFTASPPTRYEFTDLRNLGKIYYRWSFSTIQHPCFRPYGEQFYDGKVKKLPELIDELLTPRSIAYWYMDNGAQKWKGKSLGVRFCTDNFTKKESLEKKGNGWRIYISSFSYDLLKDLIFSYFIKSMVHKFPTKI